MFAFINQIQFSLVSLTASLFRLSFISLLVYSIVLESRVETVRQTSDVLLIQFYSHRTDSIFSTAQYYQRPAHCVLNQQVVKRMNNDGAKYDE